MPEGFECQVPYNGAVSQILHQMVGGLRAAMGYTGQRTIDEMGCAWIGWYDLTDEEYEAQVAARQEARRKTDN